MGAGGLAAIAAWTNIAMTMVMADITRERIDMFGG